MTLGRSRQSRNRGRDQRDNADRQGDGVQENVVDIRRVAKTVAGGRNFTFNALVVVGDGKGMVGFGLGKAKEVPEAVQKGTAIARRSMVPVNLVESSVPQQIVSRFGGAQVMLKPASPGTGIRASAAVRAVVQAAGVTDILTKSQGSSNPINVVQATLKGLRMMKDPRETVSIRRVIRGEAPLPPIEKSDEEQEATAPPEPKDQVPIDEPIMDTDTDSGDTDTDSLDQQPTEEPADSGGDSEKPDTDSTDSTVDKIE
ncbi:MAG: 30S ribosomal protein S5 [Chloroflexota bacterium]|nr:30S ribosomal protein S5 [Chloroflexota bacterium]